MNTWARIQAGVVVEILSLAAALTPGVDIFTPAFAATLVNVTTVSPSPQIGWTYNGTVFAAPAAPTPAAPTAAQLLAYANAKVGALLAVSRGYALSGGTSVKSDATTPTNADLVGLNFWGTANPAATLPWVDDFGVVTSITGAQAVALGQAVLAYGQSVYAVLATVAPGIAGGTITTTAAIDAAAWPT